MGSLIDVGVVQQGHAVIDLTSFTTSVALTIDQSLNTVLEFTGTPSGALNVIVPFNDATTYTVINRCGHTITIIGTVGAGVPVLNNTLAVVMVTTNIVNAILNGIPYTVGSSSTGFVLPLPVTSGGTGSTSATSARTALVAAESGVNSDITSLTGLTTPLPLSEGGTGAASLSAARTILGISSATTVQVGILTMDLTGGSTVALSSGQANNRILWFTGTPGSAGTISIPLTADFEYAIINATGVALTIGPAGGGTSVIVAAGANAYVFTDGTIIHRETPDILSNGNFGDVTTAILTASGFISAGDITTATQSITSNAKFGTSTGDFIELLGHAAVSGTAYPEIKADGTDTNVGIDVNVKGSAAFRVHAQTYLNSLKLDQVTVVSDNPGSVTGYGTRVMPTSLSGGHRVYSATATDGALIVDLSANDVYIYPSQSVAFAGALLTVKAINTTHRCFITNSSSNSVLGSDTTLISIGRVSLGDPNGCIVMSDGQKWDVVAVDTVGGSSGIGSSIHLTGSGEFGSLIVDGSSTLGINFANYTVITGSSDMSNAVAPAITATGSGTDIGVDIVPKGAGYAHIKGNLHVDGLTQWGRLSKDISGSSDITLSASEYSKRILEFIGNISQAINIIVPTIDGAEWVVVNNTSSEDGFTSGANAGYGYSDIGGSGSITSSGITMPISEGFESGIGAATQIWPINNGPVATITVDASTFHSGAHSLKVVNTNSYSAIVGLSPAPFDSMSVSSSVNIATSAGSNGAGVVVCASLGPGFEKDNLSAGPDSLLDTTSFSYNTIYGYAAYMSFGASGSNPTVQVVRLGAKNEVLFQEVATWPATIGNIPTENEWISFRLSYDKAEGVLQFKYWLTSSGEPEEWTISINDRGITAPGIAGLYTLASGTAYFDDVVIDDGGVGVGAPTYGLGHSYPIIIKTASGSGEILSEGEACIVYCNGANIYRECDRRSFDISGMVVGAIPSDSPILKFVSPRRVAFQDGLRRCVGHADNSATVDSVFVITTNSIVSGGIGVIGTMTFTSGSHLATFSSDGSSTLYPGDVLSVISPVYTDSTLSGVSFTIVGEATF